MNSFEHSDLAERHLESASDYYQADNQRCFDEEIALGNLHALLAIAAKTLPQVG